jgi:predicted MPP superfamily phosphohydrolase
LSTRPDDRAGPSNGPARGIERREKSGERRDDIARDGLEMVLDGVFRPGQWAARLTYALGLQPSTVDVDRLLVPVGRANGAPPLRIAFASDFHAGSTTDRRTLESACQAIADEKPDLLLLGGDFVTTRARYIKDLAPLLGAIAAPLGRFGVFGNHDRRANRRELTEALEKAGIRMLVNEVATLPAPHDDVAILGLDDPIRGAPEYQDLPESGVRIVLMHAPDGLMTLGDRDFDLALCGHTHGGQITVGRIKPYLPYGKLSREYADGLYRLGRDGSRALVVSRGVGCSTLPVRLGARAQVHLLTVG